MAEKDLDAIRLDKRDGVATITLNRPDKANSLRLVDYELFRDRIVECDRDDDVRVIIITGAGDRYFTVGDDFGDYANPEIAQLREAPPLVRHEYVFPLVDAGRILWNSTKASIAAINGACMLPEFLWWADLRVMADHATILERNVHIGVVPGCGGTQLMAKLLGRGRAMEMLLLGEPVSASDALHLGLVNKVVPAAELLETAETWASKIAGASPTAVALARLAVNASQEVPLEWGMRLEKFCSYSSELTGDVYRLAEEFMRSRSGSGV